MTIVTMALARTSLLRVRVTVGLHSHLGRIAERHGYEPVL